MRVAKKKTVNNLNIIDIIEISASSYSPSICMVDCTNRIYHTVTSINTYQHYKITDKNCEFKLSLKSKYYDFKVKVFILRYYEVLPLAALALYSISR